MSRNERSKLQEQAVAREHGVMRHGKPDERVRRTHERLGSALVALIQEKSIDDVTVQEVLDRASVVPRFIFTSATRMTCSSANWRRSWK